MSFRNRLIHTLLVSQTDPATSPDDTGQLFLDETGQPLGDTTNPDINDAEWVDAVTSIGLVQEMTAEWPQGAGTGPLLVDTRIYVPAETPVVELRKIRRLDVFPEQTYQAVFVKNVSGLNHHLEVQARRIPL